MSLLLFFNQDESTGGLTGPNVSGRRVLAPPQAMDGTIRKFEPAYWYINFPIPATGAIVTQGANALKITMNLYTTHDNLSQIWESKDTKDHPLFAYGFSRNYRDCTLAFDYNISGAMRLMTQTDGPSLTCIDDLGNSYFVRLNNYRTSGGDTSGHIVLNFDTVKAGEFMDIDVPWERIEQMFIFWIPDHYGSGRSLTVGTIANGANTATITVPNGVPLSPGDTVNFKGATNGPHTISSTTSGASQTITFSPPVDVPGGAPIPNGDPVSCATQLAYPLAASVDAVIDITNISVTGGNSTVPINTFPMDAHPIRMTDGYDNAYPFTPERLVNQMTKLGYRSWYNIYIGISHHHSLKWDAGQSKYMIDPAGPVLCEAAQSFFTDLYTRLHAAGFKIVTSVSFEILDQLCDSAWSQRDWNNEQALTGWSPASTLVSPCSVDGVDYLKSVLVELADVAAGVGAPVYSQVGEPWWWDGSFSTTGVRRPFIYDADTQAAYVAATSNPVPTPFLQNVTTPIGIHAPYLDFCRQKLGQAGLALRDAVLAAHPTATTLILIFTPQFLGTPDAIIRRINLPTEWNAPAFDILQVEDYDKIVIGDYNFTLDQTVRAATDILGYALSDTQYFIGFNLFKETTWIWYNIDKGLLNVDGLGFAETFIWSREQVFRDGWVYSREAWKFFPDVTTLAACWRIERTDGTILRFTTHDRPLIVDGESYSPANSYSPGDVESSTDTSANQMEVMGITSEDITEADLILGLFEHAKVDIFMVDYTDLTIPKTYIQSGWMGQVTSQQESFRADLRGLNTRLSQSIGEVYTPECRYKFGSSRCTIDAQALAVTDTVDAVPGLSADALSRPASSGSQLETAVRSTLTNPNDEFICFSRPEAAGYFDFGVVEWLSGANQGLKMEVMRFDGGTFKLLEGMPYQIEVFDQFKVYPGCDLLATTCKAKFNNLVNFGGFPTIPGTDDVLEFPNSKSG